MIPTLALLLPLVAAGGEKAGDLLSQTMLNESKPALSREQQLLKQMQDRENVRGWRSFGGVDHYAWNEWKLIAPGIRATSSKSVYPTEVYPTEGRFASFPSAAWSGSISVSCLKLAWRYWEAPRAIRWGRTSQPGHWGEWVNAGSPKSSHEKDAMVTALCANIQSQ